MGSHERLSENIDVGGIGVRQRLTPASLLDMQIFPPPQDLAPLVTTFFRVRCDDDVIRDVQPASLGIIVLMAKGQGRINFANGRAEPSQRFSLVTPTTAAAGFEVSGPWHAFGAMLSPLGWASLTGLSARAHRDNLYSAEEVLPPELTVAAKEVLSKFERLTVPEIIGRLATAIKMSARTVPARHKAFVMSVAEWLASSLSPGIDDLISRSGLLRRRVQRLAHQYFGMPPRDIARKYRALRAAVLLSRADLTVDEIAAIEDHFYDQSHMIREIRLFAGRTPARIADPDTPYLAGFMTLRDFHEAGPRLAPIPNDLRA